MTFSRVVKTTAPFLAFKTTNLDGEDVLQINPTGPAGIGLKAEDALAFAEYIQEKFEDHI